MDSTGNKLLKRTLAAFTLPMAAFLFLLALISLLRKVGGAFWLDSPEYWIYPAQTIFCGALLIWFWREYEFRPARQIIFIAAVALLVFALWISPQALLGFAPRLDGFNPEIFSGRPAAYWTTIVFRFLRLVVVVPLVEEIFWRGFLLRYFVNEKFYTVPVGTFSWLSFAVVTVGFGFAHSPADRVAALITGALYNCVAYRTKSLASCVLAHAITNLLLGLWIMKTRQWGFW
jgi:CAAX prenyl protease-like protein